MKKLKEVGLTVAIVAVAFWLVWVQIAFAMKDPNPVHWPTAHQVVLVIGGTAWYALLRFMRMAFRGSR